MTLIRWDKVFLETLQKMFLFYLRPGSCEEFLFVTAFVGATRSGWFGLCIERVIEGFWNVNLDHQ